MFLENWFLQQNFNDHEIDFYREGKSDILEEREKAIDVKHYID